jgi:hypothetical protein
LLYWETFRFAIQNLSCLQQKSLGVDVLAYLDLLGCPETGYDLYPRQRYCSAHLPCTRRAEHSYIQFAMHGIGHMRFLT